MKKLLVVFSLLVIVCILTGCSKPVEETKEPEETITQQVPDTALNYRSDMVRSLGGYIYLFTSNESPVDIHTSGTFEFSYPLAVDLQKKMLELTPPAEYEELHKKILETVDQHLTSVKSANDFFHTTGVGSQEFNEATMTFVNSHNVLLDIFNLEL